MYADNTALLFTWDPLSALQIDLTAELERIYSWFVKTKLTMNSYKTKYVVFRSRRNNTDTNKINITLNNSRIQEVTSIKYVGVIFDRHVHWEEHIQNVCKKVAYGCYHLIRATQYFSPEILKTLYYPSCHYHIGYCLDSWGVTHKTYIQPLQTLQKRALKIISKPNSSNDITRDIFQTQRVLSIKPLGNFS